MSVLTDSESFSSLKRMAEGLMCRYKTAQQPPPKILYTDRDCCSLGHGVSKYNELFSEWTDLAVRLDAWHFMRRLARGVSSESHPLYGEFLRKLLSSIFEWTYLGLKMLSTRSLSKQALLTPQQQQLNEVSQRGTS